MKCPTCGTGNLVAATRNMRYTYPSSIPTIRRTSGILPGTLQARSNVIERRKYKKTRGNPSFFVDANVNGQIRGLVRSNGLKAIMPMQIIGYHMKKMSGNNPTINEIVSNEMTT